MLMSQPVLKRRAALVFACAALIGTGSASAMMFDTAAAHEDFDVDPVNGEVRYSDPAPGGKVPMVTAQNEVVLVSEPPGNGTGGALQARDLSAQLDLKGAGGNSADYAGFGALPAAAGTPTGELVLDSLAAMEEGGAQRLAFLSEDRSLPGNVAIKYMKYGVYAAAAGVEHLEVDGSLMNLLGDDGAGGRPETAPAAPIPATALLLLSGLFSWRMLRRWGSVGGAAGQGGVVGPGARPTAQVAAG
jgi:hypothetical protein